MRVPSEDMEQLQCKESDWSWTVDELGVLMAPTCLASPCDVCPNPSSPFCRESRTYCRFPLFLLNHALKLCCLELHNILKHTILLKNHCWIFEMTTLAIISYNLVVFWARDRTFLCGKRT